VAASLFGVTAAVVSGGLLCVVGVAATVGMLPAFWRYRATADAVAAGQPAG
jgi:hypothetical protein